MAIMTSWFSPNINTVEDTTVPIQFGEIWGTTTSTAPSGIRFVGSGAQIGVRTHQMTTGIWPPRFEHEWWLTVAPNASGNIGQIVFDSGRAPIPVFVEPRPDAPTGVTLTSSGVLEGQAGAYVGRLGATDPDGPRAFNFTIVSDPSSLFEVRGLDVFLRPGAATDFERAAQHVIMVRVDDPAGLARDFPVTIRVLDALESTPIPGGVEARGTAANEHLAGGAGNDRLLGLGGADTMLGGEGADTLDGGAGIDSMEGGLGDDVYEVRESADRVVEAAGAGLDRVRAWANFTLPAHVEMLDLLRNATLVGALHALGNELDNTITGSTGADSVRGAGGNDLLLGALGNDALFGEAGRDTLQGGDGRDLVDGGDGEDLLFGGTGNDDLVGGAGLDTMEGGLGNDLYVVAEAGDTVVERAAEGQDTIRASVSFALPDNVEELNLTAGAKATGNALRNILRGSTADDTLEGGLGADTLVGGAGNDVLDGGAEADSMVGGLGNDTYLLGEATDIVLELVGQGHDVVLASVNHTLTANVEELRLMGVAGATGTGNGLANTILGTGFDDRLLGLVGNDTLSGGAGNDTLLGGANADSLSGGEGTDIASFEAATLGVAASLATGAGTAGEALGDRYLGVEGLRGGIGADTLTGDDAANLLEGGGGNDILEGRLGNDTLDGGIGWDTLSYATMTSGVAVDLATGALSGAAAGDVAQGFEAVRGGQGDDTLSGGADANALWGQEGADRLDGGLGNDTLTGGAGQDTLTGGAGADLFAFAARLDSAFGQADLIADFTKGLDRISLAAIDTVPATAADNAFAFLPAANAAFTAGPQVRWFQAGGETVVQLEWGQVAGVDMEIRLSGLVTLAATDFIL